MPFTYYTLEVDKVRAAIEESGTIPQELLVTREEWVAAMLEGKI